MVFTLEPWVKFNKIYLKITQAQTKSILICDAVGWQSPSPHLSRSLEVTTEIFLSVPAEPCTTVNYKQWYCLCHYHCHFVIIFMIIIIMVIIIHIIITIIFIIYICEVTELFLLRIVSVIFVFCASVPQICIFVIRNRFLISTLITEGILWRICIRKLN